MTCTTQYIQLGFVVIALLGMILAFVNRLVIGKGIGKRFIQVIAVLLLIPTIVILAIQGVIGDQLLGGLLGAIIGYVLSDLAKNKDEE